MNDVFTIIGYLSTLIIAFYMLRKVLAALTPKTQPVPMAYSNTGLHQFVEFQASKPKPQLVKKDKRELQLTYIQTRKLHFLFDLLDFNHNGWLERDDFLNIAENMSIIKAETLEDEDVASVRGVMENSWIQLSPSEDEHYRISLDDWFWLASRKIVNCPEHKYDAYVDEMVRLIFHYFDDNKDDHLNILEYMSMLVSFRAEFRSAKKSFHLLDTNNDNLISKEELSAAVRTFFRSSDPDEPGNWLFGDWYQGEEIPRMPIPEAV